MRNSQNLTVLSALAVTRVLPSALISSDQIAPVWASVSSSCIDELAISYNARVPSLVPVTTRASPGRKLQHKMYPQSRKVLKQLFVLIFHSFKEPFAALTTIFLSELMDKALISERWPARSIAYDLV
ncbi:L3118 [Sugiyamaella lignohabitans]|uniref:L3118 n=1 Tax=Sugiyamaella lignohabitans TaxID=796027 RepID=A0A167FG22_9ASCO|nr:L3118 [Sugiyamaella lignohabitans]ANB15253.1 L3118 [Sugiyamaella lignohabitans]